MGRTGIVIDKLDEQNIEFLLDKIVDLIGSGEFVDLLLPWIIAAVDRKVPLTLNVQSSIVECLTNVLNPKGAEQYKIDEVQISEINRITNLLKANIASLNH
jgi:hypothetical protein